MKIAFLTLLMTSGLAVAQVDTTLTSDVENALAPYKGSGSDVCVSYGVALGPAFKFYTRDWTADMPRFEAELLVQNAITGPQLDLDVPLASLYDGFSIYKLVSTTDKNYSVWFVFDPVTRYKTNICMIAFARR